MKLVKARLAKHATDDGLVEMKDETPLGTVYLVDLDSRRSATLFNTDRQVLHEKLIVDSYARDPRARQPRWVTTGYLALDLLELPWTEGAA